MRKVSAIGSLVLLFGIAACTDDGQNETDEGNEATGSGDSTGDEEAAESSEGGNMVLVMPSDAVTLDPHDSTDVPSNIVFDNIYETLVYHDENTELQPGLAESYEQLDDLTWEFNLQEDVTFHDGEPFNADAVVANLDRLLDPDTASPRASLFEAIEDVEAVDEYTVHITTDTPFSPLPAHLAHGSGSMMSPAAIEADAEGELNLDTEPVGTGPFEFESWEQGNEIVLTNNPDYWEDPAHLDSVTYTVVPEQGTRLAMLENGEAHFVQQVEPANTERVEQMENASIVTQEMLGFEYIGFNNEVEPFDDVQVRRALSMAIDKDTIVEGLYEGYGTVADGPLGDMVFGASDDIEPLPYDPEQAEELLADAGYEDGFSTTLLTNDENPMRIQMAELAQDQLSDIGVELSIEQMEWGAYLDTIAEGNSEMFVLGWSSATGDADYVLHPNFHSDNLGAPGNQTFYVNEAFDDLVIEAREETDEETRLELYEEAEQLLIDEAPAIFTDHNDYIVGVADSVEGFDHHPNGLFPLDDVSITEEAEGGSVY
ncbi:glutathione ABC transporter substrate-binding protein [Salicibibacter kimchii]|nr:glutathione ABC transporter substrate-binding protein [Salicibibacter kimchii]